MIKERNHVAVPLMDGSLENEDTDLPVQQSRASYRTTVLLGAALAITVLIVNTGGLVWAKRTSVTDPDGIVTVYEGV
jgi:acyl-CoA thioesterase FadM